jgi:hypothetical protein
LLVSTLNINRTGVLVHHNFANRRLSCLKEIAGTNNILLLTYLFQIPTVTFDYWTVDKSWL